jgi:hypothetical protein
MEESIVRSYLIDYIYSVDKDNMSDIHHDIMHKGFKGYNNMTDIELIKLYIEYFGFKQFEQNILTLLQNQETNWDDFSHVAYNGTPNDNEKDLFICFHDDFTEWCVSNGDMTGGSCLDMLVEFGIDRSFLMENMN